MRRYEFWKNVSNGEVELEITEGKWWAVKADNIADNICNYLHCSNRRIPIPFSNTIKLKYHNHFYTLKEFYGGMEAMFHIYVHDKLHRFLTDKKLIRHYLIRVNKEQYEAMIKKER